MDKESKILSYDDLLSGLDYNPEEVEHYFNTLLGGLEKDLFVVNDEKDHDIQLSYDNFASQIQKYDDVKAQVLKQYFTEYQRINDKNEAELVQIENEYFAKKTEINDRIELDKDVIGKIKYTYIDKLYQAKKEPMTHIREVSKKIDAEYEKHYAIIFSAKDKLVQNNSEYYLNADTHKQEIEKTIRFLKEFYDYSLTLHNDIALSTKDTALRTINIYLEYIKDEKEKVTNIQPLLQKYAEINKTFLSINDDLNKRKSANLAKSFELKKKLETQKLRLDDDEKAINEHFDTLIENDTDTLEKENYIKEKTAFLKQIKAEKERLSILSSTEIDLINAQNTSLDIFKSNVDETNNKIQDEYIKKLTENASNIRSIFDKIQDALEDEKRTVEGFDSDTKDAREILYYFEQRYQLLALDDKAKGLEAFHKYLLDNVDVNKKLDILAFELLTNDEVKTMKLLEIEREFLTVDDEVKIKEIEYDIRRDEAHETENANLAIKNAKADLLLLKKDFEIDKNIKKNELQNAIYILDLRKKIDMMRCDYMCAYSRLENIEKVVDIENKHQDQIETINTQIKIQKIVEIALLEAISRKEEYENIIAKCDKDIDNLDIDTQQKIRYLNNVLEIERDNFEQKKNLLKKTSTELKNAIYPSMRALKGESGKKIERINEVTKNVSNNEENEYKMQKDKMDKLLLDFEALTNETRDHLSNLFDTLSPYFTSIDSSSYSSSVKYLVEDYSDKTKRIYATAFGREIHGLYKVDKALRSGISSLKKAIKNSNKKSIIDKAYYSFTKVIQNTINKEHDSFINLLSPDMPESEKNKQKYIDEYSRIMKQLIVEEVIRTTENLEPYYSDLNNIEESRKKVLLEIEQDLSDYKKEYLSTIRTIENEYREKLSQLNELKKMTDNQKLSGNLDIRETVSSSIDTLNAKKIQNISKNEEKASTNSTNAQNKVTSLSNEIKNINTNFDQKNEDIKKRNENYRKEMAVIAKSLFENNLSIKNQNQKVLDDELANTDAGRNDYVRKIVTDSLKVKEAYNGNKEEIIKKAEEKKADKTIEFASLYNSTIDTTVKAHDLISKPLRDFNQDINKYTEELLNKVDNLTNELDKNLEKETEDISKKIDDSMKDKEVNK